MGSKFRNYGTMRQDFGFREKWNLEVGKVITNMTVLFLERNMKRKNMVVN